MRSAFKIWEIASELTRSGTPFAVVTMVSSRGHAPQDPGAKVVVTAEGLQGGTVGGGKVEAKVIQVARERLHSSTSHPLAPELVTWNLQRDIGMSCGGEATFVFEYCTTAAWKIVIFGAGHVAQALVRALEPLDCQIMCVDPRPEWIERFPRTAQIEARCLAEPAALVPSLDPASYFMVMTQGHATDLPILEQLLRTFPSSRYIGAIGSDVKARKMRADLKGRGISETALERLHMPIGLPIGSNEPAEIAISIVAQLLQVRDSSRSA